MKRKVSLYYNQITVKLQSGYNQSHHRLHLGNTQYEQSPQEEKKKKTKEKDRVKGRRRKGKRWKIGEGEKGMERV